MTLAKLGSIYFDGDPVDPGSALDGQQFSIGDTHPGKELQWVQDGDLLVANRCICVNISWDKLNQMGFVFGALVVIDNESYLCRCLKVGETGYDPNEWDTLLDKYSKNNTLWHWEDAWFWGQETPLEMASSRVSRGYCSARDWNLFTASYQSVRVGFRPVLEPLGSASLSPDHLTGKHVRVYGPQWATIDGTLVGADDYDITLDVGTVLPEDFSWGTKTNKGIIISKSSVNWLKEA